MNCLNHGSCTSRLNRTSVGLKPATPRSPLACTAWGLNRTSVGLKPTFDGLTSGQSYGLNRTSVGLKQVCAIRDPHVCGGPQSNQRGIETTADDLRAMGCRLPQSNQRGIETHGRSCQRGGQPKPQSNQRGIETAGLFDPPGLPQPASIEPAWD